MLESRHEDNPACTLEYIAKLDELTGPRLQRLRYGRWVQAEGVVYEGWDRAVHLIDRFPVPDSWPRYWSIDFGFTNPFVTQWWAQDPDGRLCRYRELYQTQLLVEDAAAQIRELSHNEPKPRAIVCDHDAEDRGTLRRHLGMETVPARKALSPGIQAVQARLRKAGDGKPRLFLFRDALLRRDPALDEAKKPTCTEQEFDGYTWDLTCGRNKGEEPVDRDNHGLDALRYAVAHHDLVAAGRFLESDMQAMLRRK